jgi:hypothetical protein
MKAFPIVIDRETQLAYEMESAIIEEGMDLRDYFASKAMPIIMKYVQKQLSMTNDFETYSDEFSNQQIANDSYAVADAMMKARNHE